MSSTATNAAFQVPLGMHLLSGCVHRFAPWWVRLGNLETHSLSEQLQGVQIDRPVYITGIARAGTTVLLETLSRHAQAVTHRYRDYPGMFVPYWWNQGQPATEETPQERAHGDRLLVTQNSPEAMEEPLWMAFFSDVHRPEVSNVLDRETSNTRFETFYKSHIQKLLLTRGGSRYIAKGNYNLTRLAYLQSIHPDARFVVVIREPVEHIASLTKQHRLFCQREKEFPRALNQMQWKGHFEFGLDRRAVNVGDEVAPQVMQLWKQGDEIQGTARHWASLYGWLHETLDDDEQLGEAVHLVRYEDLCSQPLETVRGILEHCGLDQDQAVEAFTSQISAPDYYTPDFSDEELEIIAAETGDVAERFGYSERLAAACG